MAEANRVRRMRMLVKMKAARKARLTGERSDRQTRMEQASDRIERNRRFLDADSGLDDLLAEMTLKSLQECRQRVSEERAHLTTLDERIQRAHEAESRLAERADAVERRFIVAEEERELARLVLEGVALTAKKRSDRS